MDTTAGYVYILINPSLSGTVKIGKTQNSPDERAKELSSATGVPTPFYVAYSACFADCNAAEIFVHTMLGSNRLATNKEFFQVTVQQAIRAVREVEDALGTISPVSGANTAEKTNTFYTWGQYKAADDDTKKKILEELDLDKNLPLMTWKEQAELFKGCPPDVIALFIGKLCTEAQVKVYRDYLPVGARDKARPLLKYEARKKLGLVSKFKCLA